MSNEFETLMHDKFQMSSMGEISLFLGLQVKQNSDGIFISQDKYVAEILKKFDFASVKTASTLMETNKALVKDKETEDVCYGTKIRACYGYNLMNTKIDFDMNVQSIWATTKVKTVNDVRHIQALIDKKKLIITETSIRSDLHSEECRKVHEEVLDLEKAKSDQAIEIASLKKRVYKLEKGRMFRTTGLKRLKKAGATRRIESSNDSLGAQEDASKQGRRIKDIDADAEVTLVNETQERQDEDLMFDTGVLDGDEMFVDATIGKKDEQSTKIDDSTAGEAVTTASVEDIVITDATTTTTTRPKAREVVVQEPSEFRTSPKAQPSKSKDKGKAIMIEPKVPLKRKDQVALDEDLARNIQAQLDAEIIEEERLERQN
ncbi:retrovirus-related pol polyprotein from transposon TNT 1-94 [Tanacetum coccineum]